ncbi:multicopper oxidase family protein [Rhizobium bangladeshense]|uniref:Multicopper oxidase family protein n=1 Tax=Rhizobium bangladeshense TaxID=1138189 RepID=A0ABS7LJ79_9HYPH|nr:MULTISPECIES: multicopper oxidase family protein [Rhizobium]MBX4869741.1 multicopper oxidase family protein [Rhizobium bangladeshense]MBX4874541.1 multicopper oxidase family protein [Rhizobium bangladeshense]MBX4885749.1 multicopper oxidase family protein [Rhizobium bangladeshense]MBX4931706.1 multicopper oxidase family protein [Rhizobium bangladeshense]MBY3591539.1 multicopper oxidase family protein [Rhizobium bangladeshense]
MPLLTRRNLLKASAVAGAYGAGIAIAGKFGLAEAAPEPQLLTAVKTEAVLTKAGPTRNIMSWGHEGMPPVLRMTKGRRYAARLKNELDEPTTIHWHGLRIDNRMDGVPFVTQPYIYTGDSFDYAFTPPDAGTFWYHPHCNTLTQMGHGMTGMLIVEDPADPEFDAEVLLNLRDWRLGGDGQFIAPFRPRDAAKSGTYGTLRTANWRQEPQYDAPAGGLVRLRIAITDVTRIFSLKMVGAEATAIAIDGNPVPKRFPLDLLQIGPGQRLDLAVRMPDEEGAVATLEDIRGTAPKTIASLRSMGASLKRDIGDLGPLGQNPVPALDLSAAEQIPLVLSATAENAAAESICGTLGYSFWAINKVPWPGDTPDPTAPLAELKLGKSYVFNLENTTPHAHPIHLHGMSFTVISSSTREVMPLVSDTYLVQPDEKVQLALVADNLGDWVLHCHIIEHQKTGMTSYVRVS